jgi:hypothetical protein
LITGQPPGFNFPRDFPKWAESEVFGSAKVLGLFTTWLPNHTPEGAINRLRTILRKTALIVLDDVERSHRQRAFDWGETGLPTPRR